MLALSILGVDISQFHQPLPGVSRGGHFPVPPAPPYLVSLELIQNGSEARLLSQHGGIPPDDASNQEGLRQREGST